MNADLGDLSEIRSVDDSLSFIPDFEFERSAWLSEQTSSKGIIKEAVQKETYQILQDC